MKPASVMGNAGLALLYLSVASVKLTRISRAFDYLCRRSRRTYSLMVYHREWSHSFVAERYCPVHLGNVDEHFRPQLEILVDEYLLLKPRRPISLLCWAQIMESHAFSYSVRKMLHLILILCSQHLLSISCVSCVEGYTNK